MKGREWWWVLGRFVSGDSREQPIIGECDSEPCASLHRTRAHAPADLAVRRQQTAGRHSPPGQSARVMLESRQGSFSESMHVLRSLGGRETKQGEKKSVGVRGKGVRSLQGAAAGETPQHHRSHLAVKVTQKILSDQSTASSLPRAG